MPAVERVQEAGLLGGHLAHGAGGGPVHRQAVVGAGVVGRIAGGEADAGQEVAGHSRGDVVLVVEVQIERAEPDVGGLGDGADRRPFDPDLGIHLGGRLHQATPGLGLAPLGARWGRGGHDGEAAMRLRAAASTLTS